MPRKPTPPSPSEAAAALGRLGGKVKSEAKTAANRLKGHYGKLGGRPRKTPPDPAAP